MRLRLASGVPPAALAVGALVGVPGSLGMVLTTQVRRARRTVPLPRPDYRVDLLVDPPWVTGAPLRVAMVGDSLVEGLGAPQAGDSLVAQTAYRLAAHLGRPVAIRGYGVASSKVADVLREQVPRLPEGLDVVVVVVGGNDVTHGTPPWRFARDLERLVDEAHARTGGLVVLTGMPALDTVPVLGRPLRDLLGMLQASAVDDAIQQHLTERAGSAAGV